MRTFNVDECAQFLKIHRTTVLELAGKGELPGAKIGRAWVFLEDDLVAYVRRCAAHQKAERERVLRVLEGEFRGFVVEPPPGLVRRRKPPVLPEIPDDDSKCLEIAKRLIATRDKAK